MKLHIAIQSVNDIITNSSTEILNIKTIHTPEILEEIILNYALLNDSDEKISEEDISISKISIDERAKKLYGDVSKEELDKFNIILCKGIGIDYKKWKGELYRIEIEEHLYNTIKFLKNKFGAV